jgi:hypothetical protein
MANESKGADLGPTKAMRGFLDVYGGFKTIGQDATGGVAFNRDMATPRGIKNYENSVDISKYGLYEHLGLPYPEGVESGGNDIKIDMQRIDGVIVDRNHGKKKVSGIWKEMYEAAEKVYKAR